MIFETLKTCTNPTHLRTGEVYPCGQCPNCRKSKMLEWIMRATHELKTHDNIGTFWTFTYNKQNLPKEGWAGIQIKKRCRKDARGNLRKKDMQDFLKRIRIYLWRKYKQKIRIIGCAEYGEQYWRPHYHIFIFGQNNITVEKMTEIWGKGFVYFDGKNASNKAIQYITGYIKKKVINRYTKKAEYYDKGRIPPYQFASKGIGKQWALNNIDYIISNQLKIATHYGNNTIEMNCPRYYLRLFKSQEGIKIKSKNYVYRHKDEADDHRSDKLRSIEHYLGDDYKYEKFKKQGYILVKEEKTYYFVENPMGYYTKMINDIIIQKKLDKIKYIKEDVDILASDEYFNIMELLDFEEKLMWDNMHKKCEKWVTYNNMSTEKRSKHREKIIYLDEREKRKENYAKKIEPKQNIKICQDFLQKWAKQKEYENLNGYYGKRLVSGQ